MATAAVALKILLDQSHLSLPYDSNAFLRDQDDSDFPPAAIRTHEIDVTILVDLAKPTKISELRVKFSCQQFLRDRDDRQEGANEFYSQTVRPLNTLLKHASGPLLLSPGEHQFPARFLVPSWLPESHSSPSSRVMHRVIAEIDVNSPSFVPFSSRTRIRRAVQEFVILREAPLAMSDLRYWSGERRSAATSLALKMARYARVGGKLRLALRVKSVEQLQSCRVDIVQEETGCTEMPVDSPWHSLPGSSTAADQDFSCMAMRSYDEMRRSSIFTKKSFPMQTISTTFPAPENPEFGDEHSATLSTLSLLFPLIGSDLHARFESPLYSIAHKIRIRIKFKAPEIKEIVVNIPVTLFEGTAGCDDVPPYYEDIYEEEPCGRSRSDSVATLPLYTPKHASTTTAPIHAVEALNQQQEVSPLTTDICITPQTTPQFEQGATFDDSPTVEEFLEADRNMRAPRLDCML